MEQSVTKQQNGLTGSSLKIIAIITMFIDHLAATVLAEYIVSVYGNIYFFDTINLQRPIVILYFIMRMIGRIAFPIFIFLIVEGLEHTRNKWKYLGRLVIFALISEIPFDMAFNYRKPDIANGKIIDFTYQNVFFTLAIGLFVLILIKIIEEADLNRTVKLILTVAAVVAGMLAAQLLNTDYSAIGVLAITAMYMFRNNKKRAFIWTCVMLIFSSVLEVVALVGLIPVSRYNGERGLNLKYVFYAFYPVHLLLLRGLCLLMGIM